MFLVDAKSKVDVKLYVHPFRMCFALLDLAPSVLSYLSDLIIGKWLLKKAVAWNFHLRPYQERIIT
jgi:hypothetical protein